MTRRKHCVKSGRHPMVKVEEHGLKAIFVNTDRHLFRTVHVDGRLIENELIADYIVSKIGVGSVLIELKGTDVSRAYKQLVATARHVACLPHIERRKAMLIVCQSWPAVGATKQRMESDATKLGFHLTIRTKQIECAIETLFFKERPTP